MLVPGFVALHVPGGFALDDRRLHGVEGGEHPGNRAYPGIRIGPTQASMILRDMKDDRSRLKQDEIASLNGRDLPERNKHELPRLFHPRDRNNPTDTERASVRE